MKQVIIIHGGTSFNSYDRYLDDLKSSQIDYQRLLPAESWRNWLADNLPNADVLLPQFPNKQNAVYDEWKIYFEKLLPLLGDDVTLVGYSLGGMFLAKYLNQSPLENPVHRICLVAPGYNDDSNEDLGSFRVESARRLGESAANIDLFHSQDDPVVPFTELAKFEKDLPTTTSHVFTDRSHFFQETFPELLKVIQQKQTEG